MAVKMVLLTKVLQPGAPRIGHITEHFVLSRTLPLWGTVAALAGGVVGLLFGLLAGIVLGSVNILAVAVSTVMFGTVGVGLVQWKPWQGESVARVLMVSGRARRHSQTLTCPGSGGMPDWDQDLGSDVCTVCRVMVKTEEGMAKVHDWRRQFYVGMMPVSQPTTGAIRYVPGSRPVDRRRLGQ